MKKILPIIIVLALLVGGYLWYTTPTAEVARAQSKYGAEIAQLKATIAEKKCTAGEETYISLAQDYTYVSEYKNALATYDTMSNCYPNAYQVVSEKFKLLLNNRAAVYESWGYYLANTEDDIIGSEKKYQEAIKIFRNMIQTLGKTPLLTADEVSAYENRISEIEKYHLNQK